MSDLRPKSPLFTTIRSSMGRDQINNYNGTDNNEGLDALYHRWIVNDSESLGLVFA